MFALMDTLSLPRLTWGIYVSFLIRGGQGMEGSKVSFQTRVFIAETIVRARRRDAV
jgi:hypothetical protein